MYTDAFGALAVRGFGIVLMFASTTLTARLLGPEEYGTYSAALSLALLMATLAPVGSDRLLVRNLSTIKCPQEAGHETAIAHLCTAIVAILLLAGLLGSWLFNVLLPGNTKWAATALMAAIMFIPLTVIYLRQWAAIPIIGSRRAMMPEQTMLPVTFSVALLLMAGLGWMPGAATTATTYSIVMIFIVIFSFRFGPIRDIYRSAWAALPGIAWPAIRQRFCNGIPFVSVGIGSTLSQRCMPLIIAATCGFEETAYFALAFPFAALAGTPLGAFNMTMIPHCARHYERGEFAEASHALRKAATATFLIGAVICFVTWQLSPWLITLLGKEYTTACRLFPPLLLGVMADCLTGPTIPVMQTMRMEKTYSHILFTFIPIQFCLVHWFGKAAGIEGTAYAYLVSRVLWNLVVVTRIYQVRGLTMLPYFHVMNALLEHPPHYGNGGHQQPGPWGLSCPGKFPVESARAA